MPASGKSAAAQHLTAGLAERGIAAVPLTLDTVKEALFSHLGTGDRDYNRLLGRASYDAIFASVAAFPDHLVAVVDAWHGFQPESVVRGHLKRARIDTVIEIWVEIAPEVAAARYRARASSRSSGHPPATYADELLKLAARAQPLRLGATILVDGAAPWEAKVTTKAAELLGFEDSAERKVFQQF